MKRHPYRTIIPVFWRWAQRAKRRIEKFGLVGASDLGKAQTQRFGKPARRAAIQILLQIGIVAAKRL